MLFCSLSRSRSKALTSFGFDNEVAVMRSGECALIIDWKRWCHIPFHCGTECVPSSCCLSTVQKNKTCNHFVRVTAVNASSVNSKSSSSKTLNRRLMCGSPTVGGNVARKNNTLRWGRPPKLSRWLRWKSSFWGSRQKYHAISIEIKVRFFSSFAKKPTLFRVASSWSTPEQSRLKCDDRCCLCWPT